MKKILLFVVSGAVFALGPWADRLGPVGGAALLIALGVALALAASGANVIAAAGGALGALGDGVFLGISPAVGGAVLVGLCYGERTLRVRGGAARGVHVGLSLLVGALAGAVSFHYLGASLAVRAVVVIVAAVLVSLPQAQG